MGLRSRILGSDKVENDYGPDTIDSVVGHDDNFDDVEGQYFAPNVEKIGMYLDDLPQNAEATLNGEKIAEGREEIRDLYDSWIGEIDPQNEYITEETDIQEDTGSMVIEVGEIKQNTYEEQGNRIGESNIKDSSELPDPGIGRKEILDVEFDDPEYTIEVTWDRVT